jgi:hypothetical protein
MVADSATLNGTSAAAAAASTATTDCLASRYVERRPFSRHDDLKIINVMPLLLCVPATWDLTCIILYKLTAAGNKDSTATLSITRTPSA